MGNYWGSVNNFVASVVSAVRDSVPKVVEGLKQGFHIKRTYRIIFLGKVLDEGSKMSKSPQVIQGATKENSSAEIPHKKPIPLAARNKQIKFKASSALVKDIRTKSSNLRAESLTSKDIEERLGSKVFARRKR